MHKAQVSTETTTYIHCPSCGARAGSIDHMVGRDSRWSCDACGVGYRFKVDALDDVKVEIDREEGIDVPCFHVLTLPPQKSPVHFVIKWKDYGRGGKDGRPPFDGAAYFFDEHTCPTNWTGTIEMIVHEADGDPHGLFQYEESADIPPTAGDELDDAIRACFPHLFVGKPD